MTDTIRGPRGTAAPVPLDPAIPGTSTTVALWLLTGDWHPLWSQFVLCVVHLREEPGAPSPHLRFPGATHELLVIALDPTSGIRSPGALTRGVGQSGGHLEPIDVVHQFTATDDEMREVATLAVRACVDGGLTPSTDDARSYYREAWLTAIVKTLAHMRGEEHAP